MKSKIILFLLLAGFSISLLIPMVARAISASEITSVSQAKEIFSEFDVTYRWIKDENGNLIDPQVAKDEGATPTLILTTKDGSKFEFIPYKNWTFGPTDTNYEWRNKENQKLSVYVSITGGKGTFLFKVMYDGTEVGSFQKEGNAIGEDREKWLKLWDYHFYDKYFEKAAGIFGEGTEGWLARKGQELLEEAIRAAIGWAAEMLSWGIQLTKSFVNATVIVTDKDFQQNSGITSSWAAVRNMSNILFILGVIIIALANVFRFDIEQYDIRILLPKLIIAMILINLSFLMCRAIIDLSNAMSETFIHMNTTVPGFNRDDIVENLVGAISKTNIENALSSVLQASATAIGLLLLIIVMLLVGFVAGLFLMLVLLVRIIMIWFLVIISPIVFLFSVLPFTQGLTKTWWSNFAKFVFMGPIVCLLLSLGERVALSFGSGSSYWLVPFYSIGMIFAAAIVPMTLGGKIVGSVGGVAKGAGKFAGKKGWDKAWTGRADGKGEGGLRSKGWAGFGTSWAERGKKADIQHEMIGKETEKAARNKLLDQIHQRKFNTATQQYEGLTGQENQLIEKKLGSNIENVKNASAQDLARGIRTRQDVLSSVAAGGPIQISQFNDQGEFQGTDNFAPENINHRRQLEKAGIWNEEKWNQTHNVQQALKTPNRIGLRDKLQFQAERTQLGNLSLQPGSGGREAIQNTLGNAALHGPARMNDGRDLLNNKGNYLGEPTDFSNESKYLRGPNF